MIWRYREYKAAPARFALKGVTMHTYFVASFETVSLLPLSPLLPRLQPARQSLNNVATVL
jgi:hypothetical protein